MLAESLGMSARGHEVRIAAPSDGALAARARESGLEVIPLSFRRDRLPIAVLGLSRLLRRLRPDVTNSHSSADSWVVALARSLGSDPGALVRSRHISAQVDPGPLHRFLYGQADYLITTGEKVRGDLAESGLFPLARSTSIPSGVDPDRFRPEPERRDGARRSLGIPATATVIGVVAYLREDKGHSVLLRAMPQILEACPDCLLVVVGDGGLRAGLESLATDLGVRSAVRFAGHREDIPDVLAALDIFCLPSVRNEGVPQSLLQAGAAGLPAVSTKVGGIPEAVADEVTGLLVPPDDSGALAGALSRLIRDPEERSRLGRAARGRMRDGYSVERMLDLTERAYEEAVRCAAARRPPGPGRRPAQ